MDGDSCSASLELKEIVQLYIISSVGIEWSSDILDLKSDLKNSKDK